MNRIQLKFEELKNKKQKALVTFITAGDPDLETTEKLIETLVNSGADLIELGVPFSDPMADGPVIQRASERALQHNTNLRDIFKLVQKIRPKITVPMVLMGYYNPILSYGTDQFCVDAKNAGVDGLIVVDLPLEESAELDVPAKKAGLDFIYLLTPTADANRIEQIKKVATGFIYYVSMTGVTGTRISDFDAVAQHVKQIRKKISLPVCIGFGIKTEEDAKKLSQFGDGVVVGSALVSIVEESAVDMIPRVQKFVTQLKRALT